MTHIKEGARAPVFKGKDQDGNIIGPDDFIGKKVVLYFYPKDDTPGCTAEACNLRDNYDELLAREFAIIGVSPDNGQSHTRFRGKYQLPFTLVADPDKEIIKAYGVWGEKNRYGKKYEGVLRTTFIIDEKGIIIKIISNVNTGDHAAQILESLGLTK